MRIPLRIRCEFAAAPTAHANVRDSTGGVLRPAFFFEKEGGAWKYDYPSRVKIQSDEWRIIRRKGGKSTVEFLRDQIAFSAIRPIQWREEALDGPLASVSP